MHYHLHILVKIHFQSRFLNLLSAQDPRLVVRPAILPAVYKAPKGWSCSGFCGPRIPCEPVEQAPWPHLRASDPASLIQAWGLRIYFSKEFSGDAAAWGPKNSNFCLVPPLTTLSTAPTSTPLGPPRHTCCLLKPASRGNLP